MEILSFPFLFARKSPSMCTHFATVLFDARNHWYVRSPIGDTHNFFVFLLLLLLLLMRLSIHERHALVGLYKYSRKCLLYPCFEQRGVNIKI